MVTFTCPSCGQERIGVRRRCYFCTAPARPPEVRERIRKALTGVRHPPERVRANSEGHKGRRYGEDYAKARSGRPAWNRVPVGTIRVITKGTGQRQQIKCADGRWRYLARFMWEQVNGPIPRGHVIHHVNHDPLDDRLDNFQLLTNGAHTRHHADSERSRAAQLLGVEARKRNDSFRLPRKANR